MHAVIGAVCDGRYLVRKAAGTCIKKRQLGALLRWKGNLSGLRGNAVYALWCERSAHAECEQCCGKAASEASAATSDLMTHYPMISMRV